MMMMMMMMFQLLVALVITSIHVIHSYKIEYDDVVKSNHSIDHDVVTSTSCSIDNSLKADCGYYGIQESGCLSKGCCWYAVNDGGKTPWCFYGTQSTNMGYFLSDMKETTTGYVGILSLIGSGSTTYGEDIKQLSLEVILETIDIVRVKVTDTHVKRWEVPETIIPRPHAVKRPNDDALNYKFSYTESPFTFEVTRTSDGRSLFKLDSNLIYKNQYLEVTTTIDEEAYTYGLGESTRLKQALASDHTYTLWAADIAALGFNQNLYGSFPFYIQMIHGTAHGVMLMNSNGMDVTLSSNKLTFKPVGGIIDLYVFSGSTPTAVVEQYTSIVGRPAMMPYWSLGFHNCKYGYTSLKQVEEVVANYSAAGIPLDTQWMDIDYMDLYKDFTTDPINFPLDQVAAFVDELHINGQHFVPIVDPGIMVDSNYSPYTTGVELDLYIKDLSGGYYLGQVWPGPTYFPDFLHPSSQDYWTKHLSTFHSAVSVDGIWIDMNEVSNFCNVDGTGQVCANTAHSGCPAPGASQTDCCLSCSTIDPSNPLDFPPYKIQNLYGRLSTKTIAMSATHYGNVSVYNAHNLYGLTEQIATNRALSAIRQKRPFLLTRSSFLSTGRHSAKWTGDNGATWDNLKSSIVSIMDFNLFGIPMVGADICGFIFDTTEELCARWIEVGAFYPFSRNHNAINQKPQELYLWKSVSDAAINALGMRYQLLPYLYTLFYHAHVEGATVARALWVNFPSDSSAFNRDGQFMLGSAVLISPVLTQGATSVNAYFPTGYWYDFQSRKLSVDSSSSSQTITLSTPLTAVNVHIHGGSIIPLQAAAMTTTVSRATPFTLLVTLCPHGKAFGNLFWDDGEQLSLDHNLYLSFEAHVNDASSAAPTSNTLTSTVISNTLTSTHTTTQVEVIQLLQTITILGNSNQIRIPSTTKVSINKQQLMSDQVEYDATKNSLTFINLNIKMTDDILVSWGN